MYTRWINKLALERNYLQSLSWLVGNRYTYEQCQIPISQNVNVARYLSVFIFPEDWKETKKTFLLFRVQNHIIKLG